VIFHLFGIPAAADAEQEAALSCAAAISAWSSGALASYRSPASIFSFSVRVMVRSPLSSNQTVQRYTL
jgi:hypothetical protein